MKLSAGWEHYKGSLGGVWEAWRELKLGGTLYHLPWESVELPHCYNQYDAVDPDVVYYQGQAWYRTLLDVNNPYPGGRMLLRFEGAGQSSVVYVGTEEVGRHVGGYDEFIVDITEATERSRAIPFYGGKVPIAVMTDNSRRDLRTIPSDMSDFNLYGGLYRHVHLEYAPAVSLSDVHIETENVSNDNATICLKAKLYNPARKDAALRLAVTVREPSGKALLQQDIEATPWEGVSELILLRIETPELWSPARPQLYSCEIKLVTEHGESTKTERFGLRFYEFVEKGPFMLNGSRLLIKGTHRHDDHAGLGAAMTDELIREELALVKSMGANFLRLGHYQQSKLVLDLCDELGILVWEEIPWCRGGLGDEGYRKQCKDMLQAMIEQHYNHPSIIIWGLGNENDWEGDFEYFDQEAIRAFMKELHDLSHTLDPHRVTGIRRCEFCKDIIDVYSPSIWAGWYRGIYPKYEDYSRVGFEGTSRFIHMEWGADAMAGRHVEHPYTGFEDIRAEATAEERDGDFLMTGGDPRVSVNGDWSETYFCDLIDWHLKSQERMEWLTGTAQWVFKDFSTPLRPENPVPYVNQKGVVERDLTKKEPFYVFQSYWSEEPMVRIYGHSWKTRWGAPGEKRPVRVYSNCESAELFVNGVSCGTKVRDTLKFPCAGLYWEVPFLSGSNTVRVEARRGEVNVSDEVVFDYQTEVWTEPAMLRITAVPANSGGMTLKPSSGEDVNEEETHTRLEEAIATVLVEAFDAAGRFCPDASNVIRFSLAGEGRLIGNLGTARGSRRVELANGRATIQAAFKPDGIAIVCASSEGLTGAQVQLD